MGKCLNLSVNCILFLTGHDNYSNYYRELDIEKAVTKTSYTVDDVTYTREALASFPDRVIVMHLTASKPKSISFTAFYSTPQPKANSKNKHCKAIDHCRNNN